MNSHTAVTARIRTSKHSLRCRRFFRGGGRGEKKIRGRRGEGEETATQAKANTKLFLQYDWLLYLNLGTISIVKTQVYYTTLWSGDNSGRGFVDWRAPV